MKSGKFVFPYIAKRKANNLQILLYHRVNDEKDHFFEGVPVDIFSQQMEYLSSYFHILPLVEAAERMKRNDLPDNALVVTFDDGYKDNYQYAFPILKKFSIPATIFLATGPIGSQNMLWHDRVFSAFRHTQKSSLLFYGQGKKMFSLKTLEEKIFAQGEILNYLRSLDGDKTDAWIEWLTNELEIVVPQNQDHLMLNWDQIKEMSRWKISFGAHTVTHPILSNLSFKKAWYEINESKQVIEKNLNTRVTTFAYPNGREGDFNETTKNILKDLGMTYAATTIFGTNEKGSDLLELRRGGPWESFLPLFATKMYWYKFCG